MPKGLPRLVAEACALYCGDCIGETGLAKLDWRNWIGEIEVKMKFILWALGLFFTLSILCNQAWAEPWLGNRFAQNCVACHAPGRVNLPTPQRRCTLSCQGCHVNPNGGGLRNYYGRWTSERWLSTWRPKGWKLAKPKPGELASQPYALKNLEQYIKGLGDNPAKEQARLSRHGAQMLNGSDRLEEESFDKHTGVYEQITEPDYAKFLLTVPESDPLRDTRDANVIGGGDIRYFNYTRKTNSQTKQYSVPMTADIGTQVLPMKHLSAVIEARFMNAPTATKENSEWDDLFTSIPYPRSAYLLVDDLPYNTFIMSGLYRPMFGNYNPDHTNLLNSMTYGTNQSMRAIYKTTSIGTAPNVPFLNVHLLSPMDNTNYSQDKGYIVNAGGRFVTLGASFMLSYWETRSTSAAESQRRMTSFNLGGTYRNLVATIDMNRIHRETPSGTVDEGLVYALETKYRLWRENYFLFNYSSANTGADLSSGLATEMQIGFKSYLISGLEFEILDAEIKNKTSTGDANESRLQGQLHFYF